MNKFRIFISSVQREFANERRMLAEYIRTDALLGRFFDVFLFEESIVRRCLEVGLPKPEYHPDNVDFKAVIWRNPGRLGLVGAQSGRSQGAVGALSRGTKSGHQVKALSPEGKSVETVFERVAASCIIPRTALELMHTEGRTDRTKFKKSVLDTLLSDGILEYTIPDKPRSRLQKYRLTEKGRTLLSV